MNGAVPHYRVTGGSSSCLLIPSSRSFCGCPSGVVLVSDGALYGSNGFGGGHSISWHISEFLSHFSIGLSALEQVDCSSEERRILLRSRGTVLVGR